MDRDEEDIKKRFEDFDEELEEAIDNLLWDVPTDLIESDVDKYIGPFRLDDHIKTRIRESKEDAERWRK